MIHFVGAGPGAMDLITVRGKALLEQADVVIYAGSLVNPRLLSYCKEGCEIHDSATMTLEEILAVMDVAEQTGRMTVRLVTGDPSLYGAIAEQLFALEQRGVECAVTPGVTAAFGAAASLKLEFTLPDAAQSLILTRQGGRTAVPERERIASFAAHRSTMAIYLSAGMGETLRRELLVGGYPETTPVVVVYKATWEDERIICSNVNKFVDKLAEFGITKTALILVGENLRQVTERETPVGRSKLYDPSFATEYRSERKNA